MSEKFCKDCLHFSRRDHALTHDCRNIKVLDAAFLVDGERKVGTTGDAYLMRLSNNACGPSGKWWEPLPE
jgi:hypothetical protein